MLESPMFQLASVHFGTARPLISKLDCDTNGFVEQFIDNIFSVTLAGPSANPLRLALAVLAMIKVLGCPVTGDKPLP